MKKIFALLAVLLAFQAGVYAQKPKTVAEQDVPERYIKDFQRQAPDVKNVVWTSEGSDIYMVTFDKNASEATGTMEDQMIARNTNAELRANAFVRAGYKFAGWATSASGAKVYDDKQSVKNISQTLFCKPLRQWKYDPSLMKKREPFDRMKRIAERFEQLLSERE
jgi:hypothetical protein